MQGKKKNTFAVRCDRIVCSLEAFEFVLHNAKSAGRVSKDQFLQAYGFTKPQWPPMRIKAISLMSKLCCQWVSSVVFSGLRRFDQTSVWVFCEARKFFSYFFHKSNQTSKEALQKKHLRHTSSIASNLTLNLCPWILCWVQMMSKMIVLQ